ncbi:DUF6412 domain-containing protein [Nocardia sp. CDC159]|uniref:DUF6412 domain-containing protein n=1 Tax=Nocardia pulmonis TaxID=2951408 RepID=A0A9X2E5T7_9NOCA|nr:MULTISPECIES: DUF6412 domain-containing protein [Nocardia]MCM6774200.1 DUF6412 domain-containing protein [Nocardia pulmonis]MCM6787087.1 DUF6412 domain-containing protein [Nocardia sp. CDC159]
MTRFRLAPRSAAALLPAWVTVLLLAITATVLVDGASAMIGAGVALALLLAAVACGSRPPLRLLARRRCAEPREERRLRGAFRRQSAPDTPGRPRLPRAPGRVPAAA